MVSLIRLGHWLCSLVTEVFSHLWSGEVTGCLFLQGGATCWTPVLGRAVSWVPQSLLLRWVLRLCFPTRWCHFQDCVRAWPQVVLQGWTRPHIVLCDQEKMHTVPRSWAGMQDDLCCQAGLSGYAALLGKIDGWALWLGTTCSYILQWGSARDYAPLTGRVIVQVF